MDQKQPQNLHQASSGSTSGTYTFIVYSRLHVQRSIFHLHSCLVQLLPSQISLLNAMYLEGDRLKALCEQYIIHRELCTVCLALRGTDATPRPLARRWPEYVRQISRELVALAVVHGGWLLCRHGVLVLNTWSRHVWRTAATMRKVSLRYTGTKAYRHVQSTARSRRCDHITITSTCIGRAPKNPMYENSLVRVVSLLRICFRCHLSCTAYTMTHIAVM